MIPSRARGIDNHEHIRTIEQIVSEDKGGMVISPQIGLHEDILALDYDNEYATRLVPIHVIPMSIVRQWSIKEGDKLDWSWEARNSEMVVVVRKVKTKK